ncbi:MAG: membrane protein insertion efficiency factor YidD [Planctomycetota bacterium]
MAEPVDPSQTPPITSPRLAKPAVWYRPDHFLLRHLIHFGVATYRVLLAPFLGGQCRFQPTCSQYMLDAVAKHGPYRGFLMGLRRISRCHPLSKHHGYDPP